MIQRRPVPEPPTLHGAVRRLTDAETELEMPNIGPLEIAIVLVVVLVIFGPKRLPELGKSMGNGIREFKGSITGDKKEDEKKAELETADSAH